MRLLLIQHASERRAAEEHQRLARGTTLLATISATAPLAGFLGTAVRIVSSFRGSAGPQEYVNAAIIDQFGIALIPTALSLATATFAGCLRNYLRSTVGEFDTEMRAVTLDLMNDLRRTGL